MARQNTEDYAGNYRIKNTPSRLVRHNEITWKKIEVVINTKGGRASFDELCFASKDHQHGSKTANYPYQFVTYCIRSGVIV
ncbi:MAG: hypothetical protein Q8O24_05595 [Gallionellaceae bacterium]|nr:hypothetical protein [Gallionellaceae bacterium]